MKNTSPTQRALRVGNGYSSMVLLAPSVVVASASVARAARHQKEGWFKYAL